MSFLPAKCFHVFSTCNLTLYLRDDCALFQLVIILVFLEKIAFFFVLNFLHMLALPIFETPSYHSIVGVNLSLRMLKATDVNKELGVRINYRHRFLLASNNVRFGQLSI